jgi:hypothetical protein
VTITSLFAENDQAQISGAVFSKCRTWRYVLWRRWKEGTPAVFIGLNPSTADETEDDPTIRRCIGFAKDWGYSALYMLNLFGVRATNPKGIHVFDPIGPQNDAILLDFCRTAGIRVAAWGIHGTYLGRDQTVTAALTRAGITLSCLGRTRGGQPRHPLYLPKNTIIEGYP